MVTINHVQNQITLAYIKTQIDKPILIEKTTLALVVMWTKCSRIENSRWSSRNPLI